MPSLTQGRRVQRVTGLKALSAICALIYAGSTWASYAIFVGNQLTADGSMLLGGSRPFSAPDLQFMEPR